MGNCPKMTKWRLERKSFCHVPENTFESNGRSKAGRPGMTIDVIEIDENEKIETKKGEPDIFTSFHKTFDKG